MSRHEPISFPFNISEEHTVPLVQCFVGTTRGYVILDSGAGVSILNSMHCTHRKNFVASRPTMTIAGLFSTDEVSSQEARMRIELVDKNNKTKLFNISGIGLNMTNINQQFPDTNDEHPVLAIMGSDWLQEHNAVIDYENQELIINDLSCKQ